MIAAIAAIGPLVGHAGGWWVIAADSAAGSAAGSAADKDVFVYEHGVSIDCDG